MPSSLFSSLQKSCVTFFVFSAVCVCDEDREKQSTCRAQQRSTMAPCHPRVNTGLMVLIHQMYQMVSMAPCMWIKVVNIRPRTCTVCTHSHLIVSMCPPRLAIICVTVVTCLCAVYSQVSDIIVHFYRKNKPCNALINLRSKFTTLISKFALVTSRKVISNTSRWQSFEFWDKSFDSSGTSGYSRSRERYGWPYWE